MDTSQREHEKGEVNLLFPYKAVSIKMYFMSNFKAFWSNLSVFSFFLIVDLGTNPPLETILPKAMNDCYYCVLSECFSIV